MRDERDMFFAALLARCSAYPQTCLTLSAIPLGQKTSSVWILRLISGARECVPPSVPVHDLRHALRAHAMLAGERALLQAAKVGLHDLSVAVGATSHI